MPELQLDAVRPEAPEPGRHLFVSWLLATFAGWLAGLFLVIIAAVLGDLLGYGGFQVMLGAGMGAGVGYLQARIVRYWSGTAGPWIRSSVIGIGIPFLVSDLLTAAGIGFSSSILLSVAAGGLLSGFLQARILQAHSNRANWWIAASLTGWALAAGTSAVSGILTDVLTGFYGALINLVLILSGGVVLGAVTGAALLLLVKR